MKKAHVIIGLLFLAMFTIFVGCGEDEALGPSLSLYGGEFIDGDETVAPGAVLAFAWHAQSGDAKLESMTISRDGVALVGWDEKEIPNSENENYTDTALLEAPRNVGEYTYSLIVTDRDALTASKSVLITVESQVIAPNVYANRVLGSYSSATGSSFVSADGTVITLGVAFDNSSSVDIVFFHGSRGGENEATLAAPNDAVLDVVFNVAKGPEHWPVRNATKLKIVSTDFDNLTDANDIPDVSSDGGSKVTHLQVGDVIAFKTASTSTNPSRKGLVKVVNINDSQASVGDALITLDFKVEP
jgi:hypothetical protein